MGHRLFIPLLIFLLSVLPLSGQEDARSHVPVIAFRSNLLLPLMNIGVEVPVSDRVSVEADFYSPWLPRKCFDHHLPAHKFCVQAVAGTVGCRYWPGRLHRGPQGGARRLCGHSVGFVASGGIYDFEWDWNGQQGEFAFIGIDYLYALPLGRGGLRFEFNVGVGFGVNWFNDYDVRYEGGWLLDDGGPQLRHMSAPVRLGVSVVLPVFRKAVAVQMEGRGDE